MRSASDIGTAGTMFAVVFVFISRMSAQTDPAQACATLAQHQLPSTTITTSQAATTG